MRSNADSASVRSILYAFDLLELNGEDLPARPPAKRDAWLVKRSGATAPAAHRGGHSRAPAMLECHRDLRCRIG
jgi:hypothetical protein